MDSIHMCFEVYLWGPGLHNWVQQKEVRDNKLDQRPAQKWLPTLHSNLDVTKFVLYYRMLLCIVT